MLPLNDGTLVATGSCLGGNTENMLRKNQNRPGNN